MRLTPGTAAPNKALKPSGKYELANWTFRNGDAADPDRIAILAEAAAALNAELGDPTRTG